MDSFEKFYENCCEVKYGNLLTFREVFITYRRFCRLAGLEKNRLTWSNLFARFNKLNNDVRAYKVDRGSIIINISVKNDTIG